MNILGCLDRPTGGTYVLEGEDVSKLSKTKLAGVRNRKIGFVFQSYNLLPRLTAAKNVMLPLLYNGHQPLSDEECHERAIAALESVGLGDRVHHRPNELSGGQQQRVAIARALVNNPSILLADEPTGNLDTQSSEEILELLHQLHDGGATIVMVTHEPGIADHAERVIYLLDGSLGGVDAQQSTFVPDHAGRHHRRGGRHRDDGRQRGGRGRDRRSDQRAGCEPDHGDACVRQGGIWSWRWKDARSYF